MAAHTSEHEQRNVAGYDISVRLTSSGGAPARLVDVYATLPGFTPENVCLTAESLEAIPGDETITDLLEAAADDGALPCRWRVDYAISPAGERAVVREAECVVVAAGRTAAGRAAVTWVHDNDAYADVRLDPVVTVREAERLTIGV